MNSVFFQGQAVESSQQNTSLDLKQSGTLSLRRTVRKHLLKESRMGLSTKPQYSPISKHSSVKGTPKAIREWLMSSRQDSHASRSALPENSLQKTIRGTNGRRQGLALASYDRGSRIWRTSQASCLNHISDEFSGIWPKSGMMQDGKLYPRKKQAIVTKGIGRGLWPTPTLCGNHNRKGLSKTSGDGLETAVKNFPTPTAQDFKIRGPNSRQQALSNIDRLFPTPTNSMVTIQDLEQARFSGSGGKRPKYGNIFPTPTVNDSKNTGSASQKERNSQALNVAVNGLLNPDWVEWLMGWPIGWSDLKPLTKLKWLDPSIDPHPAIPRTTDIKISRVSRLKAIGNGQVPLCAAMAWGILIDE